MSQYIIYTTASDFTISCFPFLLKFIQELFLKKVSPNSTVKLTTQDVCPNAYGNDPFTNTLLPSFLKKITGYVMIIS